MRKFEFKLNLISRALLTAVMCLSALLILAACSSIIPLSEHSRSIIASTDTGPRSNEQADQTVKLTLQAERPAQGHVNTKKQRFFAFLKPLLQTENARIAQQRKQLLSLRQKHHLGVQPLSAQEFSTQQLAWLNQLASEYGLKSSDSPDAKRWGNADVWQALLMRVDVLPFEMALVQAANESAWGISRFAQQGNNYFGQWCYQKGCGLVPRQRASGANHEVRRFANAGQSVRAYMRNINTSRAYLEFRKLRHNLRVQHRALDAQLLVVGLKSYSERGMAYVKTLQSMIRSNRRLMQAS